MSWFLLMQSDLLLPAPRFSSIQEREVPLEIILKDFRIELWVEAYDGNYKESLRFGQGLLGRFFQ